MNVADAVMDRSAETLIPQFYRCISVKALLKFKFLGFVFVTGFFFFFCRHVKSIKATPDRSPPTKAKTANS